MCAETGRLHRWQAVAPNRWSASRSSGPPQLGQCTATPSGGRDGVMRCRRVGVGAARRAAGAEPPAITPPALWAGVARGGLPLSDALAFARADASRNSRSRGVMARRSLAETIPRSTSVLLSAAGVCAASIPMPLPLRGAWEMSDRRLRPTRLISANATPANARARAPYVRFTATRTNWLGSERADPAQCPAGSLFGV